MKEATGKEPDPNHHGVVSEVKRDGYLIDFTDGTSSPWDESQVEARS